MKHQYSPTLVLLGLLMLSGGVVALTTKPALAQTFLEPSTPLGGPTAAPLNSSNTTQRKNGSLIIGSQGGSNKLCLNTNAVGTDANFCIASWTDLGSLVGGYVTVRTNDWNVDPDGSGPLLPGPLAAQSGYARIKANGDTAHNQLNTVIAEASNAPNAAAVYAYVDPTYTTAWAAYFYGRVYIGDGTGGSAKKLCLNDVDDFPAETGTPNNKGCITKWSDISGNLSTSYVLLQAAPGPLSLQTGGEALTGAGVFGTDTTKVGGTVLGLPVSGTNVCYTCGDGICSTGEAAAGCTIGNRPAACTNVPIPSSIPAGPGGDC